MTHVPSRRFAAPLPGAVTAMMHSSQASAALQHSGFADILPPIIDGVTNIMLASWKTKYGNRRVKQALPTIEEALTAAECMSSDPQQQVEIAASLLGVEEDEVREVARKMKKQSERRLTLSIAPSLSPERRAAPRPVLVEYRAAKRLVGVR